MQCRVSRQKSSKVTETYVASIFKVEACYLFRVDFSPDLFLHPENEGDLFPRNVGWFSIDYTPLYPIRLICIYYWIIPGFFQDFLKWNSVLTWNRTQHFRKWVFESSCDELKRYVPSRDNYEEIITIARLRSILIADWNWNLKKSISNGRNWVGASQTSNLRKCDFWNTVFCSKYLIMDKEQNAKNINCNISLS
jgi:hypothetical protein